MWRLLGSWGAVWVDLTVGLLGGIPFESWGSSGLSVLSFTGGSHGRTTYMCKSDFIFIFSLLEQSLLITGNG